MCYSNYDVVDIGSCRELLATIIVDNLLNDSYHLKEIVESGFGGVYNLDEDEVMRELDCHDRIEFAVEQGYIVDINESRVKEIVENIVFRSTNNKKIVETLANRIFGDIDTDTIVNTFDDSESVEQFLENLFDKS